MKTSYYLALLSLAALAFTGCESDHHHPHDYYGGPGRVYEHGGGGEIHYDRGREWDYRGPDWDHDWDRR